MKLLDILKDSNYSLSQFNTEKIESLEEKIKVKDVRGKETPFIFCLVRKKDIKLTPEEAVRQLYLMVLRDDYGYPVTRMELEYIVTFGREKKRADIVVFDKDQTATPYIIVELKSPKLKDGKDQLKSYCNGTGAHIGVWTNGDSISYYHRKDPNFFEDIPTIPRACEKLSDILSERWSIEDLIKKDKLVNERKSLKDLILEMEDEVLANVGVDVFDQPDNTGAFRICPVAGDGNKVHIDIRLDRTAQIGIEETRTFQDAHDDRKLVLIFRGDLVTQLGDAVSDLFLGEKDSFDIGLFISDFHFFLLNRGRDQRSLNLLFPIS